MKTKEMHEYTSIFHWNLRRNNGYYFLISKSRVWKFQNREMVWCAIKSQNFREWVPRGDWTAVMRFGSGKFSYLVSGLTVSLFVFRRIVNYCAIIDGITLDYYYSGKLRNFWNIVILWKIKGEINNFWHYNRIFLLYMI